jgi:hypothetical protein
MSIIKVSQNNNIFTAGTIGFCDSTNSYWDDFITYKYYQCSENSILSRHINKKPNSKTQITNPSINIYPNPNDGTFTLETHLPNDENVLIEAYDIVGNKVLSTSQFMQKGDNKINMMLNDARKGIYIINVKTDKEVFNNKIIVE